MNIKKFNWDIKNYIMHVYKNRNYGNNVKIKYYNYIKKEKQDNRI